MRRNLLISVVGALFLATISGAQKLTDEQANRLVDQYKTKEEASGTKLKEEESKISEIKEAIAELDERIGTLNSEISKAREEAAAKPAEDIYVVQAGDWLAKLAEYPEVYGHGNYALWPRIYQANRDLIQDPTIIQPGWRLKVPRE
ncbi:MAG: hypothetical protein HY769_05970 [Candidatus Stahlbacteria bacterium]|nr:hypothetical protein [Candidatus Stahlbacteria bacterium]